MRLAILMSIQNPWLRDAAVQLSRVGNTVHVIALRRPSPGKGGSYFSPLDLKSNDIERLRSSVAGVHVIDSHLRSQARYLLLAPTLRRLLRHIRADALLSFYAGGFAAMAYASGFRPYAVYVVGSDVLLSHGVKRSLTRVFLNAASQVFVTGTYLTQKTRELAPVARLMTLYLGVDTKRFSPRPKPSQPVRIVCTRGFLPVYNNDYLIQGLARMPDVSTDFAVTFAAGGPALESARQLADECLPAKVRRRVEFLGGVDHERLMEIVTSSHIYVSASRSDGTSSSLLEALSTGVFPILSDIPQNREWINDNGALRNGILVPLDEPNTLGNALHHAIHDDQWRDRVADYNRNLVMTRADSHRNVATLAATLDNMVGAK